MNTREPNSTNSTATIGLYDEIDYSAIGLQQSRDQQQPITTSSNTYDDVNDELHYHGQTSTTTTTTTSGLKATPYQNLVTSSTRSHSQSYVTIADTEPTTNDDNRRNPYNELDVHTRDSVTPLSMKKYAKLSETEHTTEQHQQQADDTATTDYNTTPACNKSCLEEDEIFVENNGSMNSVEESIPLGHQLSNNNLDTFTVLQSEAAAAAAAAADVGLPELNDCSSEPIYSKVNKQYYTLPKH